MFKRYASVLGLLFAIPLCLFSQQNAISPDHLKSLNIRSIGPGAMSGRITAIAVDPTRSEIIYAGAASGGVWRSTSGGTSWEPIFDKAPTQGIGSIAIHPRNPDEIWVGTGEGNPRNSQNFGVGIFKSIDGGENWTCMGLRETRTIHRIILHRDDPNTLWAASLGSANGPNDDRGVFKSSDGGKTWRKVLFVNNLTGCAELVADPANPNKLFAAMWEYQRWPWFFKSGGKGSGLYVSHDGGETWEKRTSKDGLPEGDLGRLGLAVAASNPNVVYALLEAKENALYKSTDGGKKWQKMAEKGMGDRPFYYAEIYVDPKNENRVYSIHTVVTRSEDGGKTFDTWAGWRIHPDHHAFWIHPENPDFIINGNDGGLNITRDGGRTWRYAENIPVGQFYHINVDNDMPYNIYGGLQDNGTWVGPSSVWKAGGIRNQEWQEILFGDGFDAMPHADNNRYAYAMYQGGNLYSVDRQTGKDQYIKPMHPEGKTLRFNWNSALAQDPFNKAGIYYGSQYLHYSPDHGNSWQLLSPDLTSNDSSKLDQFNSGGLTFDATNAENHCTVISIAPSVKENGVVWVGTDDGRLQLTRDGGKNWEEISSRLPDCPKGVWIPQIEVSAHNAGEVFVVVNNYRMNDWQPYLYHTTDYGKKWSRIAGVNTKKDKDGIQGFCLSVVQDLVEPRLLFLGTDQGLYVSFDYGENWQKWPGESFPSVPVQDMKIHPRDGDLVIGTFGRAIWILDNLAPLRALAAGIFKPDAAFKAFPAQDGILASWSSYSGARFSADAMYSGANKGTEVSIPVWIKPEKPEEKDKKDEDKKGKDKKDEDKKEKDKKDEDKKGDEEKKDAKPAAGKRDKVTVTVLSEKGDTLRRFKTNVDTAFNRVSWGMETKGVHFPSNNEPPKDQLEPWGGPQVMPGNYKVVMEYKGNLDSVNVRVQDDPRRPTSTADREVYLQSLRDFYKEVEQATTTYNRLRDAEKTIKLVEDQFVNVPDSLKKDALKLGSTLRDSIAELKQCFFSQKEVKGIQRSENNLNSSLYTAQSYLTTVIGSPTPSAQIALQNARKRSDALIVRVDALFGEPWKTYKDKVEAIPYSLFKE